ncbi:hypothetical protein I79_023906 [Cricetulus griseus]|uniref:Uncharacterized protein n=1 Tax=Cricetulus griseus TaxID=10029 RepID=G3IJ74_CRIGR|nr:hypothetical protein I79_023906 [Cricetulus griseus]
MRAPAAPGGQKKASDSLKPKLEVVLSCHVVLIKSRSFGTAVNALPLSCLSSPDFNF